jgi:hypothetical protein
MLNKKFDAKFYTISTTLRYTMVHDRKKLRQEGEASSAPKPLYPVLPNH